MNALREATLDEKVAALRDPASYPGAGAVRRVEPIETHMSWVFLTETHAYKLKKPVRYAYLDFSTLEARARACAEELRLNRRLAAEVYLAVVALARTASGRLAVEAAGEPVEWLIKMQRLPAADMLDARLRAGAVAAHEIAALAARLARFHREAPRIALSGTQYRARLTAQLKEQCVALGEPGLGLAPQPVHEVCAALEALLARAGAAVEARAALGRIVEGHGDLRPEHVCLAPQPLVIDCLEFNREYRIVDALDELAFLAMECDRAGAPGVGASLLAAYASAAGDTAPQALVQLYKALRALLRAKLSLWHVRELPPPEWPKWQQLARDYLAIAGREARSALEQLGQ